MNCGIHVQQEMELLTFDLATRLLLVNCPPLGLSGQQSNSGGSAASAVQLYSVHIFQCTAELFSVYCLYNYLVYCTLFCKTSFAEKDSIAKTEDIHTDTHTHTKVSIELLRN